MPPSPIEFLPHEVLLVIGRACTTPCLTALASTCSGIRRALSTALFEAINVNDSAKNYSTKGGKRRKRRRQQTKTIGCFLDLPPSSAVYQNVRKVAAHVDLGDDKPDDTAWALESTTRLLLQLARLDIRKLRLRLSFIYRIATSPADAATFSDALVALNSIITRSEMTIELKGFNGNGRIPENTTAFDFIRWILVLPAMSSTHSLRIEAPWVSDAQPAMLYPSDAAPLLALDTLDIMLLPSGCRFPSGFAVPNLQNLVVNLRMAVTGVDTVGYDSLDSFVGNHVHALTSFAVTGTAGEEGLNTFLSHHAHAITSLHLTGGVGTLIGSIVRVFSRSLRLQTLTLHVDDTDNHIDSAEPEFIPAAGDFPAIQGLRHLEVSTFSDSIRDLRNTSKVVRSLALLGSQMRVIHLDLHLMDLKWNEAASPFEGIFRPLKGCDCLARVSVSLNGSEQVEADLMLYLLAVIRCLGDRSTDTADKMRLEFQFRSSADAPEFPTNLSELWEEARRQTTFHTVVLDWSMGWEGPSMVYTWRRGVEEVAAERREN